MPKAVTETALVEMPNEFEVRPAPTMTEPGVAISARLSATATTMRPAGAGLVSVTVPVVSLPPTTEFGLTPRLRSATALLTVKLQERLIPLYVALMVATRLVDTGAVETQKVFELPPPGTSTLAGTLTAVELSESCTLAPPAGAGFRRFTCPVATTPPATVGGVTERPDIGHWSRMKVVDFEELPIVAVTVTVSGLSTARVATVKSPVVDPSPTVMVAGVVTTGESSERVTTCPPVGAVLVS